MRRTINGVVGAFIVPTEDIYSGIKLPDIPSVPIYMRGFGNGYVIVDKTNPYYGKNYNDVEGISVHGGLTFSAKGVEEVPSQIWLQKPPKEHWEDLWVFGFDTAHWGDNKTTCNQEYVTMQVWSLFTQLGQSKKIAKILSNNLK